MRRILHIGLVLLLALACQGPRTIPRDQMEDILYDILVQDQQVKRNRALRQQADTSQVYAGIFQAHGYQLEDFRHSLSVYLEDPAHMEKMMAAVAERLEKNSKEAQQEVNLQQWRRKLMRIYDMQPDTAWPRQTDRLVDTLRIRFAGDSIWMHQPLDSLDLIPRDSLFFLPDCLQLFRHVDTLAVKDSIPAAPEAEKEKPKLKETPKRREVRFENSEIYKRARRK